MSGVTPLPDKPVAPVMGNEDYAVIVRDGKVRLAPKGAVANPEILDAQTQDRYQMALVMQDGHLCLIMQKIQAEGSE